MREFAMKVYSLLYLASSFFTARAARQSIVPYGNQCQITIPEITGKAPFFGGVLRVVGSPYLVGGGAALVGSTQLSGGRDLFGVSNIPTTILKARYVPSPKINYNVGKSAYWESQPSPSSYVPYKYMSRTNDLLNQNFNYQGSHSSGGSNTYYNEKMYPWDDPGHILREPLIGDNADFIKDNYSDESDSLGVKGHNFVSTNIREGPSFTEELQDDDLSNGYITEGGDLSTNIHIAENSDVNTNLHTAEGNDLNTNNHMAEGDLNTNLHMAEGRDLNTNLHMAEGSDLNTKLHMAESDNLSTKEHIADGGGISPNVHIADGGGINSNIHIAEGGDLSANVKHGDFTQVFNSGNFDLTMEDLDLTTDDFDFTQENIDEGIGTNQETQQDDITLTQITGENTFSGETHYENIGYNGELHENMVQPHMAVGDAFIQETQYNNLLPSTSERGVETEELLYQNLAQGQIGNENGLTVESGYNNLVHLDNISEGNLSDGYNTGVSYEGQGNEQSVTYQQYPYGGSYNADYEKEHLRQTEDLQANSNLEQKINATKGTIIKVYHYEGANFTEGRIYHFKGNLSDGKVYGLKGNNFNGGPLYLEEATSINRTNSDEDIGFIKDSLLSEEEKDHIFGPNGDREVELSHRADSFIGDGGAIVKEQIGDKYLVGESNRRNYGRRMGFIGDYPTIAYSGIGVKPGKPRTSSIDRKSGINARKSLNGEKRSGIVHHGAARIYRQDDIHKAAGKGKKIDMGGATGIGSGTSISVVADIGRSVVEDGSFGGARINEKVGITGGAGIIGFRSIGAGVDIGGGSGITEGGSRRQSASGGIHGRGGIHDSIYRRRFARSLISGRAAGDKRKHKNFPDCPLCHLNMWYGEN